jgi:hypothetical protein
MPKFLTGRHYNEEEISRHLKKKIWYWPVQINDNKFATSQILKKPVEVVKGRILAGWAQKSPEPWLAVWFPTVKSPLYLSNKLVKWSTAMPIDLLSQKKTEKEKRKSLLSK